MTELVAVARLVLAGVFVVSAIAKLRDRSGAREAVVAFGVPTALVGAVAAGLPFAELAAAVLLVLPDPAATTGSVLALVLLAGFTAAIVTNLVRGNRFACHCFGSMSDTAEIGWGTVARNGAFLVLALISLVGAGSQSCRVVGRRRPRRRRGIALDRRSAARGRRGVPRLRRADADEQVRRGVAAAGEPRGRDRAGRGARGAAVPVARPRRQRDRAPGGARRGSARDGRLHQPVVRHLHRAAARARDLADRRRPRDRRARAHQRPRRGQPREARRLPRTAHAAPERRRPLGAARHPGHSRRRPHRHRRPPDRPARPRRRADPPHARLDGQLPGRSGR